MNTRAKDIRVGDIALASSQDHHHHQDGCSLHIVTRVSVVQKYGLFNPYTMSGNIIVNNVSVSTHSEWIFDPVFDALGLTSWLPSVYQLKVYPLRVLVHLLGPDLYAKTFIASRLTKTITGGISKPLEILPTLTVIELCGPLSLLVALCFLQKRGKRVL